MSTPVLLTILVGTILNPLNSSMIAVALARVQDDFGVSGASASWLISGYYLAGMVALTVLGRLVDQLGARRLSCVGFLVVIVTGALAPLAPTFGWVLAARVAIALGTSAAFPAGLAIMRDLSGETLPAATLGWITVADSAAGAIGPVVGGGLVYLAGWQGVFAINVLGGAAGLLLALRVLPTDHHHRDGLSASLLLRLPDWPGILLFAGTLVGFFLLLLSLKGSPLLWLAAPVGVSGVAFVAWERRRAEPFIDLRLLAANRKLLWIYGQYIAASAAYFGVFFSVPLWLERVRGLSAGGAGLAMLPISGLGVLAAPIAARLIASRGPRSPLLAGSCTLLAGTLLILTYRPTTPIVVVMLVGCLCGITNGFHNLGLQAALFLVTEPHRTGAAAGLLQTSRYLGALLSAVLIGIVFSSDVTTGGLHRIAIALAALSLATLLASLSRIKLRAPSY